MTSSAGQSLRILLVDDDDQLRVVAARILRRAGYATLDTSNEAAAIELMRKEPIDVLMTDVTMPGMGGVRLAAAMRELFPRLIVVFVSGALISAQTLASVPRASFVRKPFTNESLVAGIQQAVSG